MAAIYSMRRTPDGKEVLGGIDLVYSPDDGGWYAQEYDFTRADNATRTSTRIYGDRMTLKRTLDAGKHRWKKWG